MVCEQIRSEDTTTEEKEIKQKKEEENEINRKLTEENQEWCDWKFQIQWNKLEWVNPRSCDEKKNQFCVSSEKLF